MFLAPISSGGEPPEFLDLHYKAHPYCDHVAKFRGDRSRELGDPMAKVIKKEKTSRVKHKAFGTNVPGGLIMQMSYSSRFLEFLLRLLLLLLQIPKDGECQ